jgi:hypothetical protein
MHDAWRLIGAAAAFVWLGMVLAISFLETPLKFRAPGVTLPIGLGIGRLVFRFLNRAEIALAAVVTLQCLTFPASAPTWALLAFCWAVLIIQVGVLRPALDRRATSIIAGETVPASAQHLAYIVLEIAKVGMVAALGTSLARALLA